MNNIDWNKIRYDFPIFSTKTNGKSLVYLDNAATSQKPKPVIESITKLYVEYNANIHRGIYSLSEKTTGEYISSKEKVAKLINAKSGKNIVYTKNATESLNMACLLLERHINEGDEIIVTMMEHHSNMLPWMELAKRRNAFIKYAPLTPDGSINLEVFYSLLTDNTKILAISHVSNVLGTINPVKQLSKAIKDRGGYVVIDGAQAVGHIVTDVQDIAPDFYAFSGHKMLGPTGIGVMYVDEEFLNSSNPIFYGGEMVDNVSLDSIEYKEIPFKFEAGTQNYEGAIALGIAIDYLGNIGIENIHQRNDNLRKLLEQKLMKIPNIHIYGNATKKSSVVSFAVDGIHPHDIASLLDRDNICIRAGNHCAQPLVNSLGVPALARASIHFYNNEEDIDALVSSLLSISKLFGHG